MCHGCATVLQPPILAGVASGNEGMHCIKYLRVLIVPDFATSCWLVSACPGRWAEHAVCAMRGCCAAAFLLSQIHWPDRYVPLFGAAAYDVANEREGDIPFEEQLRGLEEVVKAGKVGLGMFFCLAQMDPSCAEHRLNIPLWGSSAGN